MNIGLFFGSFNPTHVGHLIVANFFATQTHLHQVWLVVSPQNPFKSNADLIDEHQRLTIARLSINHNAAISTCDIEFDLPKPSYTFDTMMRLKDTFPQHTFSILIGSDNLERLTEWKNIDSLLNQFAFLVYPRLHTRAADSVWATHPNVRIYPDAPTIEVSATAIRRLIKQKKSFRYWVADLAHDHIQDSQCFTRD